MTIRRIFAVASLLCSTAVANAAVVFDRSPDATSSPILIENFLNVAADPGFPQWYLERFQLTATTSLRGMDIYGRDYTTSPIGRQVLIRFWSDTEAGPTSLLYSAVTSVTAVDTDGSSSNSNLARRFAEFATPFLASADATYWVSMAGVNMANNVSLATYVNADDGGMWLGRFDAMPKAFVPFSGDMAFRLHGNEVSEPAAAGLAALGLLALLARRHRRI